MATRRGSGLMNMLAFVAIIFIGIALILAIVFSDAGQLGSALSFIAQILSYIVVAFYAFWYAARKWDRKQIWFMIAWAVAVVLIVIYIILR